MPKNDTLNFEKNLWAAADKLRGSMDASEYKHVVLGLIFLKYISDIFEDRHNELVHEGEGFEEDTDEYAMKGIFFIPPESRWGNIKNNAASPEIGKIVDEAMTAIENQNKQLKGVLPKNYARPELEKRRLGEVINLFSNLKLYGREEQDLLGRVYEYCLSMFAEAEGKRGGEFYTPACVVRTIVEVLRPYKGRVYDPACGSGGMFVQSAKFIEAHQGNLQNISVYGQESNPTTWKMCIMNLAIRGIEANLGQYNADTFTNDQHKTLKADYVLANPPFNMDWPQSQVKDDVRWKYGLPPAANANYAWMQHMTNLVKAELFSEKMKKLMKKYRNGLITNTEVVEELLKLAEEMRKAKDEGSDLGLSMEELAFYDAITKPENIKDFYSNQQLIDMTHELTEMLRKNRTIDWQLKDQARARMRSMIKRLLRKYKYPPEDQKAALDMVLKQAENMNGNVIEYDFQKKYSFGKKNGLLKVAEKKNDYEG